MKLNKLQKIDLLYKLFLEPDNQNVINEIIRRYKLSCLDSLPNNNNIDYDKFKDSIINRLELVKELQELTGELEYCIAPIGEFSILKESMFINGLDSIEAIELKIREIKQSYIDCLK